MNLLRTAPFALVLLFACSPPPEEPVRVVTFNIRFDNPGDGVDAWANRRDWVISIIDSLDPDIVGLQEALHGQVLDLESALPGFDRYGVGRDDGANAGEFSPVLVRRDRFDLLEQGTLWLSERPDSAGSRGWDAALPRIATWLRLRDSGSRELLVVNTHFDHVGSEARIHSAELLVDRFNPHRSETPVIVMGDFNAVDTTTAYGILSGSGLEDAWAAAGRVGPADTFTGFEPSDRTGPRIDYVFVSDRWDVLSAEALDVVREGRHPSDHRPVVADLLLHRGGHQ